MPRSTKIARDRFWEGGRGGHQLPRGMELVGRSSHALFITGSFRWDQLEEVVSLVGATLVLHLGGLNKPRQVQHQLFLFICRQM